MDQVDQNPYYYAAAGGVILGIATSLNYCLRGKITGMSGTLYFLFSFNKKELPQKLSIIGGMLLASGIFFDVFQYATVQKLTPFGPAASITTSTSYLGYGLAGLLVGFGTRMANGCTSGHGLCGLPRLSKRSLISVMIFLTFAIGISTVRKYFTLGFLSDQVLNPQLTYNHIASANVCIALGLILPFLSGYLKRVFSSQISFREVVIDQLVTFLTGFIFGLGLLVSGMVRRQNILGFLALGQNWNPSLLFVLGCGVLVNFFTFNYMLRIKKISFFGRQLFNSQGKIDWRLTVGSICFGLGWGIGGLCPGPGIMQLAIFTVPICVIWLLSLLLGMLLQKLLQNYLNSKITNEVKQTINGESKIQIEPKLQTQEPKRINPSKIQNRITRVPSHEGLNNNQIDTIMPNSKRQDLKKHQTNITKDQSAFTQGRQHSIGGKITDSNSNLDDA